MANVDRPNGFKPVKSLSGHALNMMLRSYPAGDRTADTTNNHGDIYVGDPVKLVSGAVLPANSGDTILGVAVGNGTDATTHGEPGPFDPSNLEKRYLALTENGNVWVCPAEAVIFEVQTATALSLTYGSLADISTDATEAHGSRTTSQSSAELVTPVNNDCKVVENNTSPDNDITLVNARHLVVFNTITNAQ